MQIDLDAIPPQSQFNCDLCIVGSGAAGLALAHELRAKRLNVVILESGRREPHASTQSLYDTVPGVRPLHGATVGRHRILGGSTTAWGGQALRLSALDFAPRPWVPHSGWPIDLASLESYYQRASTFMLTDTANFDTDLFRLLKLRPPAFADELMHYHYSKWSRKPDLRDVYAPALVKSDRIKLLTGANLTQIELSDNGDHVTALQVRSLSGASAVVRPQAVALAAGGIETARILLASRGRHRNGVGNDYDQVGRYFQDHPATHVADVEPAGNEPQHAFNTFFHSGLKYAPRLSMSARAQERFNALNASAMFSFHSRPGEPIARVRAAAGEIRRGRISPGAVKDVANGLLFAAPSVLRPAFEYAVRGRVYVPNARVELHLITEQEPNPASRVTLSADSADALGMPRAVVDWRLTDLTFHTMDTFCRLIDQEFNRLRLGRLTVRPDWRDALRDSFHHIGSTRMSRTPADGVVDPDCRVHGVDNLFIAGSSVFPTGGHSNPTLTLLALAIRLADKLENSIIAA